MPRITHNLSCNTFIAAGNNDFIHMLLVGLVQSIHKATVNIARLLGDNV